MSMLTEEQRSVDPFDHIMTSVAAGELSTEHLALLLAQTSQALPLRPDRSLGARHWAGPSLPAQSALVDGSLDRDFAQFTGAIRTGRPEHEVREAGALLWQGAMRHGAFGRATTLTRLAETDLIDEFVECVSESDRSSPEFLPFRLAAGQKRASSEQPVEALLQLAENHERKGQLENAIAVIHAMGSYHVGQDLRFKLRLHILNAKIAFRSSDPKRASKELHNYHLQAFGRTTGQPVVYEIATAADLAVPTSTLAESPSDWPTLMSRVDFRRLSRTYDSRVKAIELSDAAVVCTTPGNSYLQFVLWRSKIFIDDLNIHPRYFVGLPHSPLLASNGESVLALIFYQQRRVRLRGNTLLLGGAPNYYHWLFEYLPRLEAVEVGEAFDHVLVNPNLQAWQDELLSLVRPDIGSMRRQHLAGDTIYECERLLAPTVRPPSESVPYLAHVLGAATAGAGERIFVSRADADLPRIRIDDESDFFERCLRPFGFRRVMLSSLSVSEQLDLFKKASIVVAAHGAGLSNIVVSAPDCVVIEINNRANFSYTFFELIALARGQRFVRFLGEDRAQSAGASEDCPVHVDPRRFIPLICSLLG